MDAHEYLSPAEVRQAIEALTVEEKTILAKCARFQALKTSDGYDGYKDLMAEAYCRVLKGDRRWRRGFSAVEFFAGRNGVIRSIAWEWRPKKSAIRKEEENGDRAPPGGEIIVDMKK